MKRYAKIRLAVFLCIMLVLPSIVSVLPMTAQDVSAAQEIYVDWYYDINRHENKPIEIEKGAKFYVGDYAYIADGNLYGTATMFAKTKYSSSKKSIASVNSKGFLKAKKTGTTTIKIRYKGKTISAKFKVVKKGSLTNTDAAKKLLSAVKKMEKSIPSKITKSNALKSIKAKNSYVKAAGNYSFKITSSGFLYETVTEGNSAYTTPSNKLAVPEAGRYYYFDYLLYRYGDKNSPTSTRSSKMMKISSVSANTKQITIKLKKAITVEQILAANISDSYLNEKPNKKNAVVYINVYDKDTGEVYRGYGAIKKGSKVVTVKLVQTGWVDGVWTETPHQLIKGHTYVIGAKDIAWGDGKTVKVK